MNTKIAGVAAVILLAGTATAATLQHHPFSQLFPPNQDLDIGGKDILGASVVETGTLRANGTGSGDLSLATSGNTDFLRWDDSASVLEIPNSDLNMSGNRIQNLSDPVEAQDATTKSYVDTSDDVVPDNQALSDVLSRGNGAGSNSIDLSGNNVTDIEALKNNNGKLIYDTSNGLLYANKPNVNGGGLWISDDAAIRDYNDGWIRWTGPGNGLDMNSHQITGLSSPNSANDAATKGYVDSKVTSQSHREVKSNPDNSVSWWNGNTGDGISDSIRCFQCSGYIKVTANFAKGGEYLFDDSRIYVGVSNTCASGGQEGSGRVENVTVQTVNNGKYHAYPSLSVSDDGYETCTIASSFSWSNIDIPNGAAVDKVTVFGYASGYYDGEGATVHLRETHMYVMGKGYHDLGTGYQLIPTNPMP